MLILNKDITFVVQGPISSLTKKTTASIRFYYPQSTIIISTWKNSKLEDLDYDSAILSEDPGGVDAKVSGGITNTLRQIISTFEGLKKCNTEYAVKIRSDMVFYGKSLPVYYEKFNNLKRNSKIFFSRVLILENGTLNPRGLYEMPYHFGDWFYFGKTSDIKKIFDIDFSKKEELENAFYWKKKEFPKNNINKKYYMRYRIETIHTYFHIKKKIKNILLHSNDVSSDNIKQSEFHLVNDYLLASMSSIQLKNAKHTNTSNLSSWVRYSRKEWMLLHKIFFIKEKKFINQILYFFIYKSKYIVSLFLYYKKFSHYKKFFKKIISP